MVISEDVSDQPHMFNPFSTFLVLSTFRPVVITLFFLEVTFPADKLFSIALTGSHHLPRKAARAFFHHGRVFLAFMRAEIHIAGKQFQDNACNTPNITLVVPAAADQDFWGTILTCIDGGGVVVVVISGGSQVDYLYGEIIYIFDIDFVEVIYFL